MRRPQPFRRARLLLIAATTLGALTVGLAAPVHAAGDTVTWRENLNDPHAQRVNTSIHNGQLSVTDARHHPAAAGTTPGYAMELLPAHPLVTPTASVTASFHTTNPAGARISVDVSGHDATSGWSQWQSVTDGASAVFDAPVTLVQVRITLWDNVSGASPTISSLSLTARQATARPGATRPATPLTFQVFATREGLVGGTTANGHVIQPNDHFVALPSGRALSPAGSGQFSVQVCGPARCETAQVWDIGPWNTRDNYWDPSSQRAEFASLPQGTPEAQAAFDNGFNGGLDEFGRQVLNPAGIDLADGTFFNVGLNDNGFVTVTYLFTNGGSGNPPVTGTVHTNGAPLTVRSGPSIQDSAIGSLANGTSVSITCQTNGGQLSGTKDTTTLWDRVTSPAGFVSDAFIDNGSTGQVAPSC